MKYAKAKRVCEKCNRPVTYVSRRGRPPAECQPECPPEDFVRPDLGENSESAGASKTSASESTLEPISIPEEVNPGESVVILPHEHQGVTLPQYSGTLTRWESDDKGPYAIIDVNGTDKLARPQHIAIP